MFAGSRDMNLLPLKIEIVRLRRLPRWCLERRTMARHRATESFDYSLAAHSSPLCRAHTDPDSALQKGKEKNVARAASLLDGIRIAPDQVFSYHHVIGRPSRHNGFVPGLELHNGEPSVGIGGGCCQVSNMLYWLALNAGMRIVERHRHSLDLFPDHRRTVPFGCGATVFYNQADLRFENPLDIPVALSLSIADGRLIGSIRSASDPEIRVEIIETEHRFFRQGTDWMRENRIVRRISDSHGLLSEHEVAHNLARTLYEPPEELRCCA
jgi:vancomycin resistance protein VanW